MSQNIFSEPISPTFNGSVQMRKQDALSQEPTLMNESFNLPAIKAPVPLDQTKEENLNPQEQRAELRQILHQNSRMYQSRWSNFSHLFKEQKFYAKAYDICRLNRFKYDSKSCEPRSCIDHKASQTDPVSPRFAENLYGLVQKDNHLRRSSSLNVGREGFIPPSDISTNISDLSHHIIASSLLPNNYESDSSVRKSQKPSEEKDQSLSDSIRKSKFEQIGWHKPYIFKANTSSQDGPLNSNRTATQDLSYRNVSADPNYLKAQDSFLSSYFDFTGRLQESSMMRPDVIIQNNESFSDQNNSIIGIMHQKKSSNMTNQDPSVIYDYIDDDPNGIFEDEREEADNNLLKNQQQQQVVRKNKKSNEQVKVKLIGDPTGKKADSVSILYHEGVSKNGVYSNHNITDIKSLIGPEIMANIILNPELVVIEGDLMKYKPGIHFKYVKRWIQITKNEIRYYKSKWNANCWDSKALVTVPFKDIKGVYRVNLKTPKALKNEGTTTRHLNQNDPKLYHFEIFTHTHCIPYMEELDQTVHMDTSSLDCEKPSMISMLSMKEPVNSTPRKIEKDHLMPLPLLRKRNDQNQNPNLKPKTDGSEKILRESIVNPQSGQVTKTKGKPIEQTFTIVKKTPSNPKTTKNVQVENKVNVTPGNSNKTKYHYVKNIEDLASWSGREKEWYYSEKRLLFSSPSNKEREIWLSIINWLIDVSTKRKVVTQD